MAAKKQSSDCLLHCSFRRRFALGVAAARRHPSLLLQLTGGGGAPPPPLPSQSGPKSWKWQLFLVGGGTREKNSETHKEHV